jgi:hypothetical protein
METFLPYWLAREKIFKATVRQSALQAGIPHLLGDPKPSFEDKIYL